MQLAEITTTLANETDSAKDLEKRAVEHILLAQLTSDNSLLAQSSRSSDDWKNSDAP